MSAARIFTFFLLIITISSVQAQQLRVVNTDLSDREKDGFSGAVRRVKVESAKIAIKEGKPIEGARVVSEVTTYDIKGRRIDSVAHPVQGSTPTGREQYRYDNKGNIIEMTLRGNDGSILSRETYEYEFDEIGNWKKMVSSIVTYEDGTLAFEPIEVTYRTLTYYYNQSIESVVQSSLTKPTAQPIERNNAATKPLSNTNASARVQPEKEKPTNDQAEGVAAGNAAETNTSSVPEAATVKHVSEDVLKAAATTLPGAEMPLVGQLKSMFRRVEVQVVVDEKGNVVSARGTSPETVFNDAAETAARKAKFSPEKLSETPAQVYGVITYDFATEVSQPALPPIAAKNATPTVTVPGDAASDAPPNSSPAPVNAPAKSLDAFSEGLSHLNTRDYAKAAEIFKALVYRNPEDARGYQHLAYAYAGEQKYSEALAAFKLALKLRPDIADARTYYLMGAAYHAQRKYSEGVKALKQGIYVLRAIKAENGAAEMESQPSLYQFQYNLGILYQSIGSNLEAIKSFREAVSLQPESAEPHYGLALVYLVMGDRAQVERERSILKKTNPDLAKKVAEALEGRTLYVPPGCSQFPCP